MSKIIPFTVILFLFTAISYAQPQFQESYANLSSAEKKVVDSVLGSFLKNHIVFLGEISRADILIGASAISDEEVATGEDLDESHYELAAEIHQDEHLAVIILPAEKGADDTYHTPVKLLGNRAYSYKVLHTVEIHGNYLTVSSSELSDKNDSRIGIAPNQRLIKNIAEYLQGEVSGNTIKLP